MPSTRLFVGVDGAVKCGVSRVSERGIELPFGIRDGVLVHISEAERGLGCGCVCPQCGGQLIARKGSVTSHHFSHYKGAECAGGVETALHLAAKQVLSEHKTILLPPVKIKFESHRPALVLHPERTIEFDDVRLEQRTSDIVPDVLAYVSGTPLFIEIRVTHKVDEHKLKKIKQLGISAIEIDLSSSERTFTFADLAEGLVHDTKHKRWLFNTKAEQVKLQILRTGEQKCCIERGMALHVDHCPINARNYRGKPYANVIDDCANCDYLLQFDSSSIICGGRHKVTTVQELRTFYARS